MSIFTVTVADCCTFSGLTKQVWNARFDSWAVWTTTMRLKSAEFSCGSGKKKVHYLSSQGSLYEVVPFLWLAWMKALIVLVDSGSLIPSD